MNLIQPQSWITYYLRLQAILVILLAINFGLKAQCPPDSNLIKNPSFEDLLCCPLNPSALPCARDWESANSGTPDYYHKCDYYGFTGLAPPFTPADGQGCVGFLSSPNVGEYVQTCLATPLDTALEYVFSAFAGYNPTNVTFQSNPFILSLYGSASTCVAPSYSGIDCPPAPMFELLAEIEYTLSSIEGWVFGQSICFKPTEAHQMLVIGGSCTTTPIGYNYIDMLDLRVCSPLLELTTQVQPSCGSREIGSIDLTVTGGTPPYIYDWDIDGVGDNDDDEDLQNLVGGSYQIIVYDANGLSRCLSIYVPFEDMISTTFQTIPPLCVGDPEIVLPTSSENIPPIMGTWMPPIIRTNVAGIDTFIFMADTTVCADSFVQIVEIIANSVDTGEVIYVGCQNDGYEQVVNGTLYNEANPSGFEIINTTFICDSTIAINFIFHPATTETFADTSCTGSGFSVEINSTIYDESNPTGQEIISNANNCDSVIDVALIFTAEINSLISEEYCSGSGQEITVNGTLYDEFNPSGMETLLSVDGCDSIVTINLNFVFIPPTPLTYNGCAGDGYFILVNGISYDELNSSGVETIQTSLGCDSIVTVDLTYNNEINTTETHNGCIGDGYSIIVNSTIYDEINPSGVEILTSSTGCDSIIDVNLAFSNEISETATYNGCTGDGYFLEVNNTIYNESNPDGVEILLSNSGCDSVIVVALEFNNEINETENYTGCAGNGYTITVNNTVYNESNPTGVEMLSGVSGCDSIITIDLIFNDVTNETEDHNGCNGDGYAVTVNNTVYNESNPAGVEMLSSVSGCDSIITIDLIFSDEINETEDHNGCSGDGYAVTVNNTVYNESNPAGVEMLYSVSGCDSIITIDLIFNDVTNETEDHNGCSGDGYAVTVNNTVYNESNPAGVEMLSSVSGCDSIITIDLVFSGEVNEKEEHIGCIGDGYSVKVNNTVYNESNPNGVEMLSSVSGCDSIITIDLQYLPVIEINEIYEGCIDDGYSVVVNGTTYNESEPTGIELIAGGANCDTSVLIDLVFHESMDVMQEIQVEAGTDYLIDIRSMFPEIDSIVLVDLSPSLELSCTDCLEPIFSASQNQTITILITDQFNCTHQATIQFNVESDELVYIPSVFSPNNDGVNDVFQLLAGTSNEILVESMSIYNRWGDKVFSLINADLRLENVTWNGSQNEKQAAEGVYIYDVLLRLNNGQVERRVGHFTLVR